MLYNNSIKATFLYRKNRFIAKCKKGSRILTVYVPNTGRCEEIFIEGATCFLEYSDNKNRKTKYTLTSIYKGDKLINIDSSAPNSVVHEGLLKGIINLGFENKFIKPEYTYGDSRFDFYVEGEDDKAMIEVKGVTLEKDGLSSFPDAPTTRGMKHMKGLANLEEGIKPTALFVIQLEDVNLFTPNFVKDKNFSNTLVKSHEEGVNILCYNSIVTRYGIEIKEEIPYTLEEIWNWDLRDIKIEILF